MAERHSDERTMERSETVDPHNPPRSVVQPELRRSAAFAVVGTWYYLGPIVLILVVIGIALFYWANPDGDPEDVSPAVGTIGESGGPTPGGFNPDRRPEDTRSELEFRGAGEPPQGPMPGLSDATPLTSLRAIADADAQAVVGRRIDVQDVVVVDARNASAFWIQDGGAKAAVMAPPRSPVVLAGTRVDVSGVVEPDGQGGVRIRATRVTSRN